MDAVKEAFSKKERNSGAMQSFGHRLRNQFESFAAYRRMKELEWLEDLRQYKGIYDPDVKIEANNSKVYPKVTRAKVNIALSRLHEMLFPEQDKNWEIAPTPDPKLDRAVVKSIAMKLVKPGPDGQPVVPTKDELRIAIKKYANERCDLMAIQIDDQLTEMDYPQETKKVLRSGLQFGTGLLKGPMIGQRTKRIWEPTPEGDYEETEDKEEVPILNFVRLWDWYPDMSVTELVNMEGSYERHIMTKHDIRQLAKREDFYPEMIEKYLINNPHGNYVPANWETELQIIEVEAMTGKGSRFSMSSTNPLGDTDQGSNRPVGKKYEVLEFWGYVDGSDLEACGLPVDDVTLEYAANIWVLPGRGDGASCPIKAVLYPGALDHYKVFYFEKDETSIFGEGLPRVMRHSQKAISAAARMVLDNGSCVAGPQVEVNWSLMTPDTDTSSFYPRKIWYREGKGVDASYPAIRALNFESHIEELIKIIEIFKQFGDEETCLPTWLIGQQVNNETAQATSGRLSMTLAAVKDIVKNFDSFTENVIRALYAWNMDFSPRQEIKGDYLCKARGSSSLVMKEIRMQALAQLSTTLTPEERDYIPERDFIHEKMKAHDLNLTLLTDEEVAAKRKERSESIQNQLALKYQESEIEKNKAQSLSLTTKAKKTNTEAIKDAQTPPEIPAGESPELQAAEVGIAQTKQQAEAEKIRRENEKHSQEMMHKGEDHALQHGIQKVKTAHEVAIKEKTSQHGMRMKEEMTKASAQAKKTAAKMKPKPKPKVKT
jgi:hypothetical protein